MGLDEGYDDFRRVKEKPFLFGPPFCSQVGGKPGCEKLTA